MSRKAAQAVEIEQGNMLQAAERKFCSCRHQKEQNTLLECDGHTLKYKHLISVSRNKVHGLIAKVLLMWFCSKKQRGTVLHKKSYKQTICAKRNLTLWLWKIRDCLPPLTGAKQRRNKRGKANSQKECSPIKILIQNR